jgi:hypothetical protein
MEDRPEPYSWVGRQLVACIVVPGGFTYPLQAPERTLILEKVTELGIVASLVDSEATEDEALSAFYPWSAVLYLRPQD